MLFCNINKYVSPAIGKLSILPSLEYSKTSFNYLWGFGSKMLLSGIISFIYSNLYSLIIGKVYDSRSLGVFNKAQQLSHTYPNIIQSIFAREFVLSVQFVFKKNGIFSKRILITVSRVNQLFNSSEQF